MAMAAAIMAAGAVVMVAGAVVMITGIYIAASSAAFRLIERPTDNESCPPLIINIIHNCLPQELCILGTHMDSDPIAIVDQIVLLGGAQSQHIISFSAVYGRGEHSYNHAWGLALLYHLCGGVCDLYHREILQRIISLNWYLKDLVKIY